jgi:hypothetical protein
MPGIGAGNAFGEAAEGDPTQRTHLASSSPVSAACLLTRTRVAAGCRILLVVEFAFFIFVVAGTYGLIVPLAKPSSTDFISFYAAGTLAEAGTPELAYDHQAHYAVEERVAQPGIDYNFFYYPPVFLLLCSVLARLPYLVAFAAFVAATLVLYMVVTTSIIGTATTADLVTVLAFPPVFWTIGFGQNAFLTAALFGAATLFTDRRPLLAGLLYGGLCYKPHFALLVPVALIAGRCWRALAATIGSALGLASISLLVFGWPTWHAYLLAAAGSHAVYESGRVAFAGFVTPFGGAMLSGGSRATAYAVQAGAALAAATLVAVVWYRRRSLPVRAASLAAATLVAVPLAIVYDLMLASIAGLWLLRSDNGVRLPDWARWGLAGLFVLSLSPRSLSEHWHVPVGAFITTALFALVVGVAWNSEPRPLSPDEARSGREPIVVPTV